MSKTENVKHHVYHSEGFTDLAVIRHQAADSLRPETWPEPHETIVHLHAYKGLSAPCMFEVDGELQLKSHEYYLFSGVFRKTNSQ